MYPFFKEKIILLILLNRRLYCCQIIYCKEVTAEKNCAKLSERLRNFMRRNEPAVARLSEGRSPEFRSRTRMVYKIANGNVFAQPFLPLLLL